MQHQYTFYRIITDIISFFFGLVIIIHQRHLINCSFCERPIYFRIGMPSPKLLPLEICIIFFFLLIRLKYLAQKYFYFDVLHLLIIMF